MKHLSDYTDLIDADIWEYIRQVGEYFPEDTTTRGVAEQRKIYNTMCAGFDALRPDGTITTDEKIGDVPIRRYNPKLGTVIIFAHGGGFVLGNLETHDSICADISTKTGMELVAVDYRLSPEHSHPAALDDFLTVIDAHMDRDVILVGDSAGGTLCAAAAALRQVTAQVLIFPMLGGDVNKGSYLTHAHAPMLSRNDVLYYVDIRGGDVNDPTIYPLRATDYSKLPPTFIFPAEFDPLADDGAEYAEKINAAGGQVTNTLHAGLIHGHLRARNVSKRAGQAFDDICAAIVKASEAS